MYKKVQGSIRKRITELKTKGYEEAQVDNYPFEFKPVDNLKLNPIYFLFEHEGELYEKEALPYQDFICVEKEKGTFTLTFTEEKYHNGILDIRAWVSCDFGDAYLVPRMFINFNSTDMVIPKEYIPHVIEHLNNLVKLDSRIGDILETRFFLNPKLNKLTNLSQEVDGYYKGSTNIRALICSLFEKGSNGEIPIAAQFNPKTNEVSGYQKYEPYFEGKITLDTAKGKFNQRLDDLRVKQERERSFYSTIQSAWYDSKERLIMLNLNNGMTVGFFAEYGQETSELNDDELSEVKVGPGGYSIYWEESGIGFELSSILAGRLGSKKWMEKLNAEKGVPIGNWDNNI